VRPLLGPGQRRRKMAAKMEILISLLLYTAAAVEKIFGPEEFLFLNEATTIVLQ
jgi:hypothetical protein